MRTTLVTTDRDLTRRWRGAFEAQLPDGMELRVFPSVGRAAFSFSFSLWRWLRHHIEGYDLAVIRALFHPVSSAAAWAARNQGIPYLVVPHGTLSTYTFRHRRTRLKRIYFRFIDQHTVIGSSAIRFTSETEREEAPDLQDGPHSVVIPHPFEPSFVVEPTREVSAEPVVVFLSRLDPKKGLDVLLPALVHVRAAVPEARLVLAGSGPPRYERHLRHRVEELGLEDAVELPGFVEGSEKRSLLLRARMFVLPSKHENFGIAAVEAMDAGLPVVLSRDVAVWPEVHEAGAGLVVDRDPKALGDAIVALLGDPDRQRRMGEAGRNLVRSRYHPERIGAELHSLYCDVARSGAKQPTSRDGSARI